MKLWDQWTGGNRKWHTDQPNIAGENSMVELKTPTAEQEEFESKQANKEEVESKKRKAITQSVMEKQSEYNKRWNWAETNQVVSKSMTM